MAGFRGPHAAQPRLDGVQVRPADPRAAQVLLRVELGKDREHDLGRRGAPGGQEVVALAGAQAVVRRDLLRLDPGQGEQQQRDLAGPVTAADAVEQHAARLGARDRLDHAGVAIREAVEVGQVVERRAELGPAGPLRPELGVLLAVQRQMQRLDPRPRRRLALVVVAQVDDRADPVRAQRGPAALAQPVRRPAAHHGAAGRLAAVARRQPAQVADVDPALPVELPHGSIRSRLIAATTSRAARAAPAVFRCTPSRWRTRTTRPPIRIEAR